MGSRKRYTPIRFSNKEYKDLNACSRNRRGTGLGIYGNDNDE
jgi:hypothetical protein